MSRIARPTAPCLLLATVLVSGCAAPSPPRPATLDDAIRAAAADVGCETPQQLFRGTCADRTCVLVADEVDERRIGLIVLEPTSPYRVQASSSGSVGAEPGTIGEMATDDTEFVYGRINDDRISKLELDLLDGGTLSFDVAPRGYAVAYPERRGPVQEWRFLDDGGRVISDPSR